MIRIIGIIVLILSMAVATLGGYAFANKSGMAQMLSNAITEFDAIEWQHHWQIISMGYFIIGCIGSVAGIGIISDRKWGILIFALLMSMLLLGHVLMMVSGYAIFEFERVNIIEALAILLICCLFWYLYGAKAKGKNT